MVFGSKCAFPGFVAFLLPPDNAGHLPLSSLIARGKFEGEGSSSARSFVGIHLAVIFLEAKVPSSFKGSKKFMFCHPGRHGDHCLSMWLRPTPTLADDTSHVLGFKNSQIFEEAML